ncbi:hypothetical protein JHE03_23040 [Pluralibacter gergoviae]|uniref:hypothetical protein n=1 Tax=Pluralibacter gergoviae TaxID=61647 RepID=UPI00190C5D96|nr:hypothetical protein [Pluralibacter gergoviae]MBK4119163.1 hypothetical protein [Pluralibacter gergoviae]
MELYKTGNPVPSADMRDIFDDNRVQDRLLNGDDLEIESRTGEKLPSWKGIIKKNDDLINDTRQNLIPLSRQYMTLADARNDIANIPDGSAIYIRSADGSSLADEYINNGGALEPTGRKMPSADQVNDIDGRIKRVIGENIAEIRDAEGNVVFILSDDGMLYLTNMSEPVQQTIGRVSSALRINTLQDIFRISDGQHDTFIQASDGRIYVPLLQMSIQDEINSLKKSSSSSQSIASVETHNQIGAAAYIVVPDGYIVDQIKWLRDGVVIPGATGHAYVLSSADMMKKITMTIGSLLGGNLVSDKTAGQIGGIALESAGQTGSLYEGFTLSAGDDFNAMDILGPSNPRGRWITTRTYLNPPRGSDTLLGTMYDTDPEFTGFNDSNRGVPVGFDNMRAENGVLRLQARVATNSEKLHTQGNRHEVAAMVSSVGAFSFYAGPAGTGECIIEWYAMFTHKTRNPAGWHPSLWTQSSLPSYTYNSDELDIVEGTSQTATSNYNIWGSDGSRTGGGSLGPDKDLMDGKYHKITAVLSQSAVKIYVDDVLSSTANIDANAVREPGYLLMSSHVYNGTFRGDKYLPEAWEQLWKGATISVDWCRIWRKAGLSHIKPLANIPSANIAFGNSGTIQLPAKFSLWGRDDVIENVQCIMTDENEPGGSHTVPYNTLPEFVTYDSANRIITVSNGYTKAGRLNFVIYGYLHDGSSCEPARTWVNIGPHYTGSSLSLSAGQSTDLYPLWDCGVLVTDGVKCTKTIGCCSLPDGVIFDSVSSRITNFGAAAGSYVITTACRNSVGQVASQKINLTLN